MFLDRIIEIEKTLFSPEIAETPFSCDLKKCKGACCTMEGEYGAPLEDGEISEIMKVLDETWEFIPEEHKNIIEADDFFELKEGDFYTRSLNNKACVFVYYEGNVAKCSIEKAYLEKNTGFRKPISCHLFPIRVGKFGGDVLRFEKLGVCQPAVENGKEKNITVLEFCKDSLTRKYGDQWYKKLEEETGK